METLLLLNVVVHVLSIIITNSTLFYLVSRSFLIVSPISRMLAGKSSPIVSCRQLLISSNMRGRIRDIELDVSVLIIAVASLKGSSISATASIQTGSTALQS